MTSTLSELVRKSRLYLVNIRWPLIILVASISVNHTTDAQKSQRLLNASWENHPYIPGEPRRNHFTDMLLQDHLGYIWAATGNGLFRYDGTSMHAYYRTPDSTSISGNDLISVYEDNANNIWVGSRTYGLNLYNRKTDDFRRFTDHPLGTENTWTYIQESDCILWMGTDKSLRRYDLCTDQLEQYQTPDHIKTRNNGIRRISPDLNNARILWLGCLNGLYSFDIDKETFQHHPQPVSIVGPTESDQFDQLLILDLVQHENLIWCATWSGGLCVYNKTDGTWRKFTFDRHNRESGGWNQIVFNLQLLENDQMLFVSSNGVGVFDLQSLEYAMIESASEVDGALEPSFYYSGLTRTADNRLVVGRIRGFSISEPIIDGEETLIHPPQIATVRIGEDVYQIEDRYSQEVRCDMSPEHQDLSLEIVTPGYFGKEQLEYQYFLRGYDKNWQNSNSPQTRYTNLSKGEYELAYRVRIPGQEWMSGWQRLAIKKRVFFFQTPIFIAATLLLVFTLVALIYWINIRSVRRTERLHREFDRKLANVEMAALRAQMNPHFIFNSLNSIKTYVLKEQMDEASHYINKFSRLMRLVLRNSKSTVVPLSDELEALTLYIELEALRFEGVFEYEITVDHSIPVAEVAFPPLLIQPYAENAIRHGLLPKQQGTRKLSIMITREDGGSLLVVIDDNGVGRTASKSGRQSGLTDKKKSYGMQITKDRIELIRQTLGITAQVQIIDKHNHAGTSSGTRIEIRLPYVPLSALDL